LAQEIPTCGERFHRGILEVPQDVPTSTIIQRSPLAHGNFKEQKLP